MLYKAHVSESLV